MPEYVISRLISICFRIYINNDGDNLYLSSQLLIRWLQAFHIPFLQIIAPKGRIDNKSALVYFMVWRQKRWQAIT